MRMIDAGLMTDAGVAKVEAAKRDGSWAALETVDALTIPPDLALVVSDVVMPRMGGLELCPSLREEGSTMPFRFASGYTDRMSSARVALDPSAPVLPKPWTWTELTASVPAALDEGSRPC